MSNPKTGFILYFDSAPILAQLSPEQRGWLLSALFQYADRAWREPGVTQEDVLLFYPQLTPQSRTAFGFLASTIARDTQRWLRQREVRTQRRQQQGRGCSSPGAGPSASLQEAREQERCRENMDRIRREMERLRREEPD